MLLLFVYWNFALYSSGLIFDETEQGVPEERITLLAVHRWYVGARLLHRGVPVNPPRGVSRR